MLGTNFGTNGSDNHNPWMKNKVTIKHPIVCPHCKRDTGFTQEGFMFYYAQHDVLCPHCSYVILPANNGVSF